LKAFAETISNFF